MDITIPEFADCLMIILSFCDLAGIQEIKLKNTTENDIVKLFTEANKLTSSLTIDLNKDNLLKIISEKEG